MTFSIEQEAEILKLIRAYRPFAEIAEKFSTSQSIIRNIALKHDLIIREGGNLNRRQMQTVETSNGSEMMQTVRLLLGNRCEERDGRYWLDGLPATLGDVIRAANRIQRAWFRPQLGRNSAWHVTD